MATVCVSFLKAPPHPEKEGDTIVATYLYALVTLIVPYIDTAIQRLFAGKLND